MGQPTEEKSFLIWRWKKTEETSEEAVWPGTSDSIIVPLSSIKYFDIKWHQIQPVQKNDYMESNLVDQCQRVL